MAAGGVRVPIHMLRFNPQHVEELHPATMAEARGLIEPNHLTWINVNATSDPEIITSLERDFGVHPLTLEDIRNTHQRPKVEAYSGYLYVVVQMLKAEEDGSLDTEQVSILVGDGWLVTVQEGKPGDVFDGVRDRIRAGRPNIRSNGADYLLYALVDALVDAYFPMLEAFGERAEALEEAILEDTPGDVREDLQQLRRDLLTIRRVAWPLRDAMVVLERGEERWIKPVTRTFFRDVSDHATRVIDFVETNRELVASLMDLYLANVTQRTNDVMKVLTVVATIFIPLTFVAGVYGMNFEHMPELEWRYGYPAIMTFMAVVGVSMYLAFKRRGWV